MRWWRKMKRKQECRRKYGHACPHMERHSKQWTKPASPSGGHRAAKADAPRG